MFGCGGWSELSWPSGADVVESCFLFLALFSRCFSIVYKEIKVMNQPQVIDIINSIRYDMYVIVWIG